MPNKSVDLASVFQAVTQTLAENKQALNQADEYNQDHGDNMVQTFQTITGALQQKKNSSDSAALAYAAKQLSKNTTSGSGQLYAQNLAQAAGQFKGKKVDPQGSLQLLQTLIGSGQTGQSAGQPAGGDMLGALLGSLAGGGEAAPQQTAQGDLLGALLGGLTGGGQAAAQPPSQGGEDMLGALLGGLTGSGSGAAGGQSGSGMNNLLAAGLAFLQARQSGGNTTQALVQAFMAGSGMGDASHRSQSTQLVVDSFLKALSSSQGRP